MRFSQRDASKHSADALSLWVKAQIQCMIVPMDVELGQATSRTNCHHGGREYSLPLINPVRERRRYCLYLRLLGIAACQIEPALYQTPGLHFCRPTMHRSLVAT